MTKQQRASWPSSSVSPGPGQRGASGETSDFRIMGITAAIVGALLLFGAFLLPWGNESCGLLCGLAVYAAAPILVPLFVAVAVVMSAWAAAVVWLIRLWCAR